LLNFYKKLTVFSLNFAFPYSPKGLHSGYTTTAFGFFD